VLLQHLMKRACMSVCRSLRSVDRIMSFVGLDQPPVEPGADDTCGINRSQVTAIIAQLLHSI